MAAHTTSLRDRNIRLATVGKMALVYKPFLCRKRHSPVGVRAEFTAKLSQLLARSDLHVIVQDVHNALANGFYEFAVSF